MCRVFGAVATTPISVENELVACANPLIRQSEDHDSGWGMASYADLPCPNPQIERFPIAAHADPRFANATKTEARIFNVHVRRATLGGIKLENTHPFDFGPYTFSHNGTILDYRALLRPGMKAPAGDTDSEHFFLRMINEYDPSNPIRSIRGVVASVVATSIFSGLNFVFSDGELLYAYRLGVFPMNWTASEDRAMVSSEPLTKDATWHMLDQDVLLTFDPDQPQEPAAQRLIGDTMLTQARIQRLEPPASLKGEARGKYAAASAKDMRVRMLAAARNGSGPVEELVHHGARTAAPPETQR
ncbi:MAG: class II glutamine amidotransferase [Thermoleophilaceae bacterium]|nr:class II glutamine amidotransferase [Thermoleophilaceae bacterium]